MAFSPSQKNGVGYCVASLMAFYPSQFFCPKRLTKFSHQTFFFCYLNIFEVTYGCHIEVGHSLYGVITLSREYNGFALLRLGVKEAALVTVVPLLVVPLVQHWYPSNHLVDGCCRCIRQLPGPTELP